MHDIYRILTGVMIAVAVASLVVLLTSKPQAQPTVGGPFPTVTAVGTSSVQIIGANPTRRGISICIPGIANSVTFAPAPITPVNLTTGITMVGSATAVGNGQCFTSPFLTNSGTSAGITSAWNAIASATTNVIVLEW